MVEIQYLIFLPLAAGLFLFLFPETMKILKGIIALIVSALTLFYSYRLFFVPNRMFDLQFSKFLGIDKFFIFNLDGLSKLVILFTGFFGFLFVLYSLSYITRKKEIISYYSYYLITLGASFGVILSNHFVLFITFWGILGVTLFKLIKGYDEKSSAAAKKSLILIGASDSLMILGIAILWKMTGTMKMSGISVQTTGALGIIAFLTLLIGSFTKAGAFPVHSWIPGYAAKAPASTSAFLPASLDKLLGIYFLVRICTNLFEMTAWATLLLLIIGAITIFTASMMLIIQKNFKKLLGYSTISQVGYMITGIGLGTPLGIAAGLFHMVNNTLYKSGLFLTAGSVEKRTGKSELDELGGLSKFMPLTFIAALVCALAISGIPPFNGFSSKWMIYQGIIDFGNTGSALANKLWIIWLIAAVFGSALTLAGFIKFISGIFLGRRKQENKDIKEVGFLMWIPQIIIAALCIVFGVFAVKFAVPRFIEPITGKFDYIGIWKSQFVSVLILISIVVGYIIYLLGNIKNMRTSDSFMLGEKIQDETSFSPLEFYKTISDFKFLSFFYKKAEKKWFDIYELGRNFILWCNSFFSEGHSGVLTTYISWVIGGLIILLIIML